MIKIFRFAICVVVVLLTLGCEVEIVDPMGPEVVPSKPTVPLKKRPIVPTTKLPRPRVVGGLEVDTYAVDEVEFDGVDYCEF